MLTRQINIIFGKANTTLFVFLFAISVLAQNNFTIEVLNTKQEALSEVTVVLTNGLERSVYFTNATGKLELQVAKGMYQLEMMHIAYQTKSVSINVDRNFTAIYILDSSTNQLNEVYITAEEGKGLSTKSVINRKAMEHLQPSSFADLMELLPGGLSKTPNLTTTNVIRIREFGPSISGYSTSALGVQFVMDGNVLNSNMDMLQAVREDTSFIGGAASKRNSNATGIDMRTISTNDIESVEIIRGIPTVSYGDLTSGLILINRKNGYTNWQARAKSDGFSKSFYVAKGFDVTPTWTLNTSFDYLNALSDPRDLYESYKRINGSIRSRKKFKIQEHKLVWNSNLDYSVNIDETKVDPDTGYLKTDFFKSQRQKISFSNNVELMFKPSSLVKRIKLTTNVNQGIEDIKQRVFVQYSGPTAVSIATEEGINEGYFPALSFVSNTKTEGRPININAKLETTLNFKTGILKHDTEAGIDYKYSYNFGRGEMYDLLTPPSTSSTTRPRAYKDVPAYQNIAFFAGDRIKWQVANNSLEVYGGLRISKMLGMDKSYELSKKVYVEPRFIFQWGLPKLALGSELLQIDITAGYGELYKQPTGLMLYPNKRYSDFTQLNFRPSNEEFQYVNFMTYVDDFTNKNLVAAKNIKKEIRLDFNYAKHNFFITYFDENMPNGFRTASVFKKYAYKRYDASGVDLTNLNSKPNIDDLPYEEREVFQSRSIRENGSGTHKTGIEFGYTSPRFKGINTRFSLTGAWFKTIYKNTIPVHEKPNTSLAGSDYMYVGIYTNDDGNKVSGMNYNFIVDTYLPALDMNISASFQGVLFREDTREWKEDTPYAYYGTDGIVYQYTEEHKNDAYLRWLIRNVSSTDNMNRHYNLDLQINLKISKRIYQDIKASLFVNKIYAYMSPYTFNNTKIYRKNSTDPYFGMELTYNF